LQDRYTILDEADSDVPAAKVDARAPSAHRRFFGKHNVGAVGEARIPVCLVHGFTPLRQFCLKR
jgi:hypothetical protein